MNSISAFGFENLFYGNLSKILLYPIFNKSIPVEIHIFFIDVTFKRISTSLGSEPNLSNISENSFNSYIF